MRRSGFGVVVLAASVLFVAVGAGVAAASSKPLPLSARLLKRGEFPGFTVEAPTSYKSPKAWVATKTSLSATQTAAEVARLTREGFKELLSEFLDNAQGPRNGLFWVVQLGSVASARAELAAEVRSAKAHGQATETFRIGAIPGAVGFGADQGNPGDYMGGENIVFTDGPFLYLAGDAWSGSTQTRNPTRTALIEAATKLYKRVHAHSAG